MSARIVHFGGQPVTLLGSALKAGDNAPDFRALSESLAEVKLSDHGAKAKLLSVFPSIDTSVCSLQTRRFNQEAAAFGDRVAFLSLSADLPFALKRFCGAEGIANLISLSDHRDLDFGNRYGFHIQELRLLARGVVVIDAQGVIRYLEIVPEIAHEPHYDQALSVLKGLA